MFSHWLIATTVLSLRPKCWYSTIAVSHPLTSMKMGTTTCLRRSGCFGHHFAAIAGAGPLVGPTLAAQFGFAPGFSWILIGAVFAGCVHDFTVLAASIRHKGRSLADIARTEVSPWAGLMTMIALLFILLVTLAGTWHCRRERPVQQPLGGVHHRYHHSHRNRDGAPDVQEHAGAN